MERAWFHVLSSFEEVLMEVKGRQRRKKYWETADVLAAVLLIIAITLGCLLLIEAVPYVESAKYQKELAEAVIREPDAEEIHREDERKMTETQRKSQEGDLDDIQTAEQNNVSSTETSGSTLYPIEMYREVDWKALKERNEDIIGWIYIPKIGADYPVLKGEDQEYLHLDADGNYRFSGSIFTWPKSDDQIGTEHCVFYGHNMADNSMFGALDLLEAGDKVYLYTPDHRCREYTAYENKVTGKADAVFQKGWKADDRKEVLTLATCPSHGSGTSRRIVNTGRTREMDSG